MTGSGMSADYTSVEDVFKFFTWMNNSVRGAAAQYGSYTLHLGNLLGPEPPVTNPVTPRDNKPKFPTGKITLGAGSGGSAIGHTNWSFPNIKNTSIYIDCNQSGQWRRVTDLFVLNSNTVQYKGGGFAVDPPTKLKAPTILAEWIDNDNDGVQDANEWYPGSVTGGIEDCFEWLDGQTQGEGVFANGTSGYWGGQSWMLDGSAAPNALEGRTFKITLASNETIGPQYLADSGSTVGRKYYPNLKGTPNGSVNITITTNSAVNRTITLNGTDGSLFELGEADDKLTTERVLINLTLAPFTGGSLDLIGKTGNNSPIISIYDSTVTMETGVTLKNNENLGENGGGAVQTWFGAKFIMKGGTITGNTAKLSARGFSNGGGGVAVALGIFEMYDGAVISNNETLLQDAPRVQVSPYGAGVSIISGNFTMFGGTITGNKALGIGGGGVGVHGGTFTMNSGTISLNEAGNTTTSGNGGGVYIKGGTFTFNGGTISGNEAGVAGKGGGVYNFCGTFIMEGTSSSFPGGEIKQNKAMLGGGVAISAGSAGKYGEFRKGGGIIYGRDAGVNLANVATAWAKAGSANGANNITEAFASNSAGEGSGAVTTTDALYIEGSNPRIGLPLASWGNGISGSPVLYYNHYEVSPNGGDGTFSYGTGGSGSQGWGFGGTIVGGYTGDVGYTVWPNRMYSKDKPWNQDWFKNGFNDNTNSWKLIDYQWSLQDHSAW
jgi:hypothetical protein